MKTTVEKEPKDFAELRASIVKLCVESEKHKAANINHHPHGRLKETGGFRFKAY